MVSLEAIFLKCLDIEPHIPLLLNFLKTLLISRVLRNTWQIMIEDVSKMFKVAAQTILQIKL